MSKYQGNVLRFSFRRNSFFVEKEILSQISSVVVTDSSDVRWSDLYPINVFTKCLKTQQLTDVMKADTLLFICYCSISKFITKVQIGKDTFLVTCNFSLLNPTLGARQVHESVHLIFAALNNQQGVQHIFLMYTYFKNELTTNSNVDSYCTIAELIYGHYCLCWLLSTFSFHIAHLTTLL